MTREEIAIEEKKLRDAYKAANDAEDAYRVAKADMFLELSSPKDGSKKPTETIILSTIDADKNMTVLRRNNMAAQAELDIAKMVFKAKISAT